jgi:hypothetical protein
MRHRDSTLPPIQAEQSGTPVPPDLRRAIEDGIADAKAGRTRDGEEALRGFRDHADRLKAQRHGKAGG